MLLQLYLIYLLTPGQNSFRELSSLQQAVLDQGCINQHHQIASIRQEQCSTWARLLPLGGQADQHIW